MYFKKFYIYFPLYLLFLSLFSVSGRADEKNAALDLSVEDLLNVEVTSVSKKAQSLNDAPAAAFVITNEDIKRSGVTSIPDALRLAPGIDVARIDANQWAVSSRGFNGRFANKLLVLIDGRSAYTRSFAGVYWENQDVVMEDIERIEVIRGPGATLWGANAMNGVINIITKKASDTQGAMLNAGGGSFEQGFGNFRYGGKLNEDTTARAYVKGFTRGNNTLQSGGSANDNWNKQQGGFRLDSLLNSADTLTVQGDIYTMAMNQNSYYPQVTAPNPLYRADANSSYGGNLLSRFQHTISPTSEYKLQFYFDGYSRAEGPYDDSRDTLDLDFQHRFLMYDRHEIVWGLNYRFGHDHIAANQALNVFTINPLSVNDQLFSGFVQDEATLIENKLKLTIGTKFEHNDYSGFEGQPSARIMWTPHNQHRLWAGVSRAVRTPSRAEKYMSLLDNVLPAFSTVPPSPFPTAVNLLGSRNYGSEDVISYEIGYRTTFAKSVSFDVTGFYNDYTHLRGVSQQSMQPVFANGSFIPSYILDNIAFSNQPQGQTYGMEIATVWQMLDWWRWDVNYSWLHTQYQNNGSPAANSYSPQQRVSLRGALSPLKDFDFDFWFRYVDSNVAVTAANGDVKIPAYVTLDLRTAWRPIKDLELSITGQNMLQDSHLEYVAETQALPTAIVRGVYGKLSWKF